MNLESRKPGSSFDHGELTERIIGAAISVHRTLGPGYLESIYEEALQVELRLQGVRFRPQLDVPIVYRGVTVGLHRLDLLVEDEVVVELKAVKALQDIHLAIVKSYLLAAQMNHGLLLNFCSTTLQIKRVWPRR